MSVLSDGEKSRSSSEGCDALRGMSRGVVGGGDVRQSVREKKAAVED